MPASSWGPPGVKSRMSYQARMRMPLLIVTARTGACGKTKRTAGLGGNLQLRHDRHEVVAVGAEAMQPDDGGRRRRGGRQHDSIRGFLLQQLRYFQLRGLPAASHAIAVARRLWRVASCFASVIHSTYSRCCEGLKAA